MTKDPANPADEPTAEPRPHLRLVPVERLAPARREPTVLSLLDDEEWGALCADLERWLSERKPE